MFNISFLLAVYLIHYYYFTLEIYKRTENFIYRKKIMNKKD